MPPSLNFTGILLLLCVLIISITTNAQPQFPIFNCTNTNTHTPNSAFRANLNILFSALSSSNATRPNGFYNFTAGRQPPDIAYGLFLCRGDLAAASCQDCVARATKEVVKICPDSKVVTIWYDECMLRYSNESIFSIRDKYELFMHNINNVTRPNLFSVVLEDLLSDVVNRASTSQSVKKFATRETNYSVQTLYGLAQCTPDLTVSDCNWCLQSGKSGFPNCCGGKQGAIFFSPSCILRYEMYPFYSLNTTAANPTPPSPVLPPPPTTQRKKGISWRVLTGIIVSIVISVLLFIIGFYFLCGKARKKSDGIKQDSVVDEITTGESLQYSLATIQAATNNFSDDNKIGAGGFGPVYKGVLTNGTEIAVKRLSQNSGQGAEEFKNEIALVVKLQHRNLVRMLGFSLQEQEKILIYEYVPNKSLDYLLFDPQQRERLDWSKRYKIIGGIARGMLYLHEDSRLRIIHRDLKASNILLDNDMNAKISDFGMARIFTVDQSQGNTSKVVGTYGYMSPEYVINGQFSIKSDVYSFGVLILEIVSGKRNNSFYQSNSTDYLLNYAWKLWRDKNPLELMDPTLEGSYSSNEVAKCIHIGLLCVQDDPDRRPNMAQIVLMLNNDSINVSVPQQPTFFAHIRNNVANALREHETNTSTSKSTWSANEASISELRPR